MVQEIFGFAGIRAVAYFPTLALMGQHDVLATALAALPEVFILLEQVPLLEVLLDIHQQRDVAQLHVYVSQLPYRSSSIVS